VARLTRLEVLDVRHCDFNELRKPHKTELRESKGNILQISENVAFTRLQGGCKNIISDIIGVVGGMNDLTSVFLIECQEIECVFNITSNAKIDDLIPKFNFSIYTFNL
jgi:hypothetical protein